MRACVDYDSVLVAGGELDILFTNLSITGHTFSSSETQGMCLLAGVFATSKRLEYSTSLQTWGGQGHGVDLQLGAELLV